MTSHSQTWFKFILCVLLLYHDRKTKPIIRCQVSEVIIFAAMGTLHSINYYLASCGSIITSIQYHCQVSEAFIWLLCTPCSVNYCLVSCGSMITSIQVR